MTPQDIRKELTFDVTMSAFEVFLIMAVLENIDGTKPDADRLIARAEIVGSRAQRHLLDRVQDVIHGIIPGITFDDISPVGHKLLSTALALLPSTPLQKGNRVRVTFDRIGGMRAIVLSGEVILTAAGGKMLVVELIEPICPARGIWSCALSLTLTDGVWSAIALTTDASGLWRFVDNDVRIERTT